METRRVSKTLKKENSLLVNFARTIGSTLGAVAAKTDALAKPAHRSRLGKKSSSKANNIRKKNKG